MSTEARVREAIQIAGEPSFSAGDKIWYRRRGETFIHVNKVTRNRGRLFAVASDEIEYTGFGGLASQVRNKATWLDRREIEILDVEKANEAT